MRLLKTTLILAGLSAVACSSAPLPEGVGRGLIAFDPTPPAGVAVYERPAPKVGDRYALMRGGQVRVEFLVIQAGGEGVVLQDGAGHQLRRDVDLGYLGEWNAEGQPVHLLSPADTRFHWPLWVGKHWRCEYLDRKPGMPVLRLEVGYAVEELDRIRVPAGTFEALRIVRTETLKVDGDTYFDRTSISWYAPAVGLEVRQLIGDTAFELVEWSAAGSAPAK